MSDESAYVSRWDKREETVTAETKFNAWLLDLGHGFQAAVAYNEMTHILLDPVIYPIPCTPLYCSHLLYTEEGEIQALADVAALVTGKSSIDAHQGKEFTIGQVIYQPNPKENVQRAALYLATPPRSISVSDSQACSLADDASPLWQQISCACINHEDEAIPILNLNNLFSLEFSQSLEHSHTHSY